MSRRVRKQRGLTWRLPQSRRGAKARTRCRLSWFTTATGAFGSIPVHPRVAIDCVDDEEPAQFLGAVTQMDPRRSPRTE